MFSLIVDVDEPDVPGILGSLPEALGESSGNISNGSVQMSSKVSDVENDLDGGVQVMPNMMLKPLSGATVGSERVALFGTDLGADVQKEGVSVIIGLLETVVTFLTEADDHDVVGQNSANDPHSLHHDEPGPEEGCNEKHAERTSLGDATFPLVGFSKTTGDGVHEHHIVEESLIGSKQLQWEAHGPEDSVKQRLAHLVEAFPDVSSSTKVRSVAEFGLFDDYRRGIPGIFGADTWKTSENAIDPPRLSPRRNIPQSCGGPEAIYHGRNGKVAIVPRSERVAPWLA